MNDRTCLLVVPPMRAMYLPSLGPSLLKSNLEKHGFRAQVMPTNIEFAARYNALMQLFIATPGAEVVNLMFGHRLFGRTDEELKSMAVEVDKVVPAIRGIATRLFHSIDTTTVLAQLVRIANDFVDHVVVEIIGRKPWLVGVSSQMGDNTFAMSVIREVKRLRPEIITVLGGANCAGEMGEELFLRFPDIDFVVQGDADHSLIELVRNLDVNRYFTDPIAGVLSRNAKAEALPRHCLTPHDLEALPDPDFSETMESLSRLRKKTSFGLTMHIPMETSRGCWWGAKKRCAFCGLNPSFANFVSKSAEASLSQFERLTERYKSDDVYFVDNLPDNKYFKDFWPRLADRLGNKRVFVETTGNLTSEQVRLLTQSGVKSIQAGIESLSEFAVKSMGKPTTPLRSIATLRRCNAAGIQVIWNYLYGVPGETREELLPIRDIVQQIVHLEPPSGPNLIAISRFSRYFENPEEYGVAPLVVGALSMLTYPFPEESVRKLSYNLFSQRFLDWTRSEAWAEMFQILKRWKRAHKVSFLVLVRKKRGAWVIDTRPSRTNMFHRLSELELRICEACEDARTRDAIHGLIGSEASETEINTAVARLQNRKILLHHDGKYLNLAVGPTGFSYKRYPELDPIIETLSQSAYSEVWRVGALLGEGRFGLFICMLRIAILKRIVFAKVLMCGLRGAAIRFLVAALGSSRGALATGD